MPLDSVSPELLMLPLTPDGLEGSRPPRGAGPPGPVSRLAAFPRLDWARGAKEAFGRQRWQQGANAGHGDKGRGDPSTYCQVLN